MGPNQEIAHAVAILLLLSLSGVWAASLNMAFKDLSVTIVRRYTQIWAGASYMSFSKVTEFVRTSEAQTCILVVFRTVLEW
jgi:hypothetical protein